LIKFDSCVLKVKVKVMLIKFDSVQKMNLLFRESLKSIF